MRSEVLIDLPNFDDQPVSVSVGKRMRKSARSRLEALGVADLSETGEGTFHTTVPGVEAVRSVLTEEYPDWKITVNDRSVRRYGETDRISWGEREKMWGNVVQVGYVGRTKLFQHSFFSDHAVKNAQGYSTRRVELTTELPALPYDRHFSKRRAAFDTVEEARAAAEKALETFVHKLGAVFPE